MRRRVSLSPSSFLCWLCLLIGLVVGVSLLWRTDEAVASPHIQQAELPWPLTPADAQRYGVIFALQQSGHWRDADRIIGTLASDLLMGHVLAQRYLHPTHYRSRYHELASWLKSYADHPDARRIYKLALTCEHGPTAPRFALSPGCGATSARLCPDPRPASNRDPDRLRRHPPAAAPATAPDARFSACLPGASLTRTCARPKPAASAGPSSTRPAAPASSPSGLRISHSDFSRRQAYGPPAARVAALARARARGV